MDPGTMRSKFQTQIANGEKRRVHRKDKANGVRVNDCDFTFKNE